MTYLVKKLGSEEMESKTKSACMQRLWQRHHQQRIVYEWTRKRLMVADYK